MKHVLIGAATGFVVGGIVGGILIGIVMLTRRWARGGRTDELTREVCSDGPDGSLTRFAVS